MIIEEIPSSSGQKNTPGFIELHELKWMAPTLPWRKVPMLRELLSPRYSVFHSRLTLDRKGEEIRQQLSVPSRALQFVLRRLETTLRERLDITFWTDGRQPFP